MRRFSGRIYKTVLLAIFLLAGINGCKKDYESIIPYVFVNFSFNPVSYIELNVPGGSVYLKNVGFGGIIVVNNWGDSNTPFLAYDAACTFEASSAVHVKVENVGDASATCPKCGSKFILTYGSPLKGPAVQPLKQYHASYSNGMIYIRN